MKMNTPKKAFGIATVLAIILFSLQLIVNGQEIFPSDLQAIAESYGCYEDKQHYENNERGVRPPYKWGFIKELPPTSSVVFWCKDKDKSKIVVHVDSSTAGNYTNPFSSCPDQITEVIGGSTGIWVENDAIYTGVEDGIYYFCKDGIWQNSEWH